MSTSIRLNSNLYAVPTPAGAFFATADSQMNPDRQFFFNLLKENHSKKIDKETLIHWSEKEKIEDAAKIIFHFQQLDYVRGSFTQPVGIPSERLDTLLPNLIAPLSLENKALLVDENGLYIASSGYPHEVAEELAAVAIDLNQLYLRHKQLLHGNLHLPGESFALVGPDGKSQLGFWPIYIGKQLFFIIVEGIPQLDQPAFVTLVKLLADRYI
jgi:hypothetical protein